MTSSAATSAPAAPTTAGSENPARLDRDDYEVEPQDFVENPRREFWKQYFSEELIEHSMDGLHKAGLKE